MSNSSEDKDEARDSRLVLRKTNQEVIRKELRANAYKHCVDETKLFADCAKKEGFMVVFKCREVLKTSK